MGFVLPGFVKILKIEMLLPLPPTAAEFSALISQVDQNNLLSSINLVEVYKNFESSKYRSNNMDALLVMSWFRRRLEKLAHLPYPDFRSFCCLYEDKIIDKIRSTVKDHAFQGTIRDFLSCLPLVPFDYFILSQRHSPNYSNEKDAYSFIINHPEYPDLNDKPELLEDMYQYIYSMLFYRKPLAGLSLKVHASKNEYVSFNQIIDENVKCTFESYVKVGQSVRKSKEYRAFIDLCQIINQDSVSSGQTPSVVICLSSGFGKSQLPFSIKDFPILYFLKSSVSSQQIYQPFAEMSLKLIELSKRDLAKMPSLSISYENLDFTFLKESDPKSDLLGFVVSLLENVLSAGDGMNGLWIERQLAVGGFHFAPLKPSEARAKIQTLFPPVGGVYKTPLIFVDECSRMDEVLKFIRNILRTAGLLPILMGTNARITNLIGKISFDVTRIIKLPWCYVIFKLAPFDVQSIEPTLLAKIRKLRKGDEFLNLLSVQRPLTSKVVVESISQSISTCTSISELLYKALVELRYYFENIRRLESNRFVQFQFFFHSYNLIRKYPDSIDFHCGMVNSHLAIISTPDDATIYDIIDNFRNQPISEISKNPYILKTCIPLYLHVPESQNEESILRYAYKVDLNRGFRPFKPLSIFLNPGNISDCFSNMGFLGIDRKNSLFTLNGTRISTIEVLRLIRTDNFVETGHESEEHPLPPNSKRAKNAVSKHQKYFNGSNLEIITANAACVASRGNGFEGVTFKHWLSDFLSELQFNPNRTRRFCEFNNTVDKILDHFFVNFLYFPNTQCPPELASLLFPTKLGKLDISTSKQSYDIEMNFEHISSVGKLSDRKLLIECKSGEENIGVGELAKKMSSYAQIECSMCIFVVTGHVELKARQFEDIPFYIIKLSSISRHFSFKCVKRGSTDKIMIVVDISLLNPKKRTHLETVLRNKAVQ